MKFTQELRDRLERLLTAPGDELGRWARFVRFQIQLWRFCARRLREHNAMAMSSALSFRTVFAMVPVFVLVGLAMKTGGALEQSKRQLREFIVDKGFAHIALVDRAAATQPAAEAATQPAEVLNLADRIEGIIGQAEGKLTFGTIGPVGVVVLIWSALTLLTTLEHSLNRIFEAPRSRSLGRRMFLYWSAVTLGPVALAAAAYLGHKGAVAFAQVPGVRWVLAAVGWASPVIVGILLLAALYKLMPNTKVSFRSAFGAALVAVPLWLVAKWAFGLYVRGLIGRPTLYGALGLIPLFMLWLNFSWLIFLFGAELAYTAANVWRMDSAEMAERTYLGPWELLAAALIIAREYRQATGPVRLEGIVQNMRLPETSVRQLLERLTAAAVVCPVASDSEAYVLARPADRIAIREFLETAALAGGPARGRYDPAIAGVLARLNQRTQEALGQVTLAEVLAEQEES